MRCIAAAVAGFIALIPPASGQDNKLNVALHACVAKAGLQRLPPMRDLDNPAALTLGCEGQEAVALFAAMELASNQSVAVDDITRRAGNIVCSHNRSRNWTYCLLTVVATAPFIQQLQ
jgi:hypothetical protein